MNNTIEITGVITSKGELKIYDNNKLQDFSAKNKDKTVLVSIRVYDKSSSKAFVGYYHNGILPRVQKELINQGVVKSLDVIDYELRVSSPVTNQGNEILKIEDLEQWQLMVFIDYWLYPHLLDNYSIAIHNTVVL